MNSVKDLPRELQWHIFGYVGNPHGYRADLAVGVTNKWKWEYSEFIPFNHLYEHWLRQWCTRQVETICGMPKKPMRLWVKGDWRRIVTYVYLSSDVDFKHFKYDVDWEGRRFFCVNGRVPRGRRERRLYLSKIVL